MILRRGDRIYFQYGCLAGEDFGTVLGEIPDERWGSSWVVRLSDFSTTQISHPRGTVAESDGVIRGDIAIGAYLIEEHDYSCVCFHCCPTAHA